MKYTITQFKKDFPNDDACLEYILKARFNSFKCPNCGKKELYRVKNRKSYACSCGYQIHPVSNTIFHKSATTLTNWFFAVYLMSKSKNGVSAKELQRHLGVTYKTAWRIGKKIRGLMKQDKNKLEGTIEADETYIGGVKRLKPSQRRDTGKATVMGIVKRGGGIRSKKIPAQQTHILLGMLADNVKFGSRLITDESKIYEKAGRIGLFHDAVNHSAKEYVRDDVYTNTIEGFFSQLKRSIDGTYHSISFKHLQSYVDEFAYHYNHRFSSVSLFHDLLYRLCGLPYEGGQKIPSFVGSPVSS